MVYMQHHKFQQVRRHHVYVTTHKTLLLLFRSYMNIVFMAQWLPLSNLEILHCSGVFAINRQKLIKPQSIFKQTFLQ